MKEQATGQSEPGEDLFVPLTEEEIGLLYYQHREYRKMDSYRSWCNACSGVAWPCPVIRLLKSVNR